MPARLIVNADDFGLTPGVNRAIAELHSTGALSSATLMANGAAFEDAVEIARVQPGLGVGCHVVLTDGVPVCPPEMVRTLLGPDGKSFRPALGDFVRALLSGRVNAEEIEREALGQIEKLERAGIAITHVDTHKHTHLFRAVSGPLLRVAERAGVAAVRNPFEPGWSLGLGQGTWKRRAAVALTNLMEPGFSRNDALRNARVLTTEGTLGISATGHLTRATLAQTLEALPPSGTYELCCHPGYNDGDLDAVKTKLRRHREVEREALLREIPAGRSQRGAFTLIHYGQL